MNHRKNPERYCFSAIILILVLFSAIAAESKNVIALDAIYLNQLTHNRTVNRSIYSLETRFTEQDSVVFLLKEENLKINSVKYINENEISFELEVLPGFSRLGPREVAVVDLAFQTKAAAKVAIIYQEWPRIESIQVRTDGQTTGDTLQIQRFGTTSAELIFLLDI